MSTRHERPRRPHRHRVRVAYIDTDRAQLVHHATYLRYLEAARIEYLRARGLDYRRLELEVGYGLPVVAAETRYRRPAHFDELIEVETWVAQINRAKVVFEQRIWREGTLLTEARITCACVRMDTRRICSMAQEVRAVLDPSEPSASEPQALAAAKPASL